MRTVEDDELRHHLGVVDGKQPCYGPAPVVADKTTSVVPLKEKSTQTSDGALLSQQLDARADVVLFIKACQRLKNRYRSHFFIAGFLPLRTFYTHQMDVFHDIQPNADQGQDIRLKGILITSLVPAPTK